MHTGEGAKHASHAAPARHPRLRALVCAAAGLEGVGGQDTTTWTAERMSEASAAVVTTDPEWVIAPSLAPLAPRNWKFLLKAVSESAKSARKVSAR